MAKRPKNNDDMEMTTIHNDLTSLKKQMGEVLTILGGSAAYDFKGMRSDVKDLKTDVQNIKQEIEKMKRQDEDRWSIKLKTIPQKIAAAVGFLALILTTVSAIKNLLG